MSNSPVQQHLIKQLVGPLAQKKLSWSKGGALGVLLFALFEFISMINPNAPRIPVPWLLALTIWTGQITIFVKTASFLRYPRREDFFFVMAMSSDQRKKLARESVSSVHDAIWPFIFCSLGAGMVLEFLVFREHSLVNLLVLPVLVIAGAWIIFKAGTAIFNKGIIRPTVKDERRQGNSFLNGAAISSFYSSMVIKISKAAGLLTPLKIRPFVIRNVMYLLRSDPLQFFLFTCTAPVLLALFMLLLIKQSSPFMEFFTILTVFVLNSYYSSHLQEATVRLQQCPYYSYNPRLLLSTHLFTVAALSLPFVFIFLVAVNVHLISVSGLFRVMTFLFALAATFLINCRAVLHPQRKDSESGTDFLIFIFVVAPGLFIPFFGCIFPLLGVTAVTLLEWETVVQHRLATVAGHSSD
ncbi:MAG TPA: hypothetical protein VHP36_07420 [Chitinispirillaceae bacterium]|nr:hypothetical protein [Chitinispirillaceae bacterium]